MKRLAIIGASDLGEMIAYHAQNTGTYEVVGFFDDYKAPGTMVSNCFVIAGLSEIVPAYRTGIFDLLMVGIGYKHMSFRKQIFEDLSELIPFANLIHPTAYVDNSACMGTGVFILPGCVVDKHVILGNNVLLNSGAVVAHDTSIGDHCFLAPSSSIAGKVNIDECCIVGINATIIDNVSIVSNVQIGAASVVLKSIYESGVYVGTPLRKIR